MKFVEKRRFENKLLRRIEVEGEIIFSGPTPSTEQVVSALASTLNVPPERISVLQIKGSFGSTTAKVIANIYNSKEDKELIEPKKKIKKVKEKKEEASERNKET
ncbi:MAG: hypothetical protein QW559_02630 [Candidatus Woesearchaeota archaeon]